MSSYDRGMLIQGQYTATPFTLPDGGRFWLPLDVNGNIKVAGPGSGGAFTFTATPVTPIAATTATIVTGGTAVTIVTGPCNGGYITNPYNLASQGIAAAENAYIDPVGTPGSTDTNGNGTTVILTPGQNYSIPALATGQVIKANAATNGHKLTVVVY